MSARKTALGGIVSLLAGLVLGLSATPVAAQYGPVISGAGPINRSMGGAATAAPLSASGALFWNPATLAGLNRSELDVGAEMLFPQTTLFSRASANAFGAGSPPVDAASRTTNEDAVFALPTIAASFHPEGSPFTYGLGVFALAGFGLNYAGSTTNPVQAAPPGGLGFGPIYSNYSVLQVAPALVYEVNEQLSVSVSPILDVGMLQLDPGLIAVPNANGTYPTGTHSRSAYGTGFSVGAYYQACAWDFGASYKSTQWFQSYRFSGSNELGAPRTFEFDLDSPAVVSVGASFKGIERWLFAADVRYLDFDNTDGLGDSGFAPAGNLRGLGFNSVWAVALGTQYQMTDAVSVRAGYSWNSNPIPDSQTSANAASPVIIQHMLSAGASYQVTEAFSLSAAYMHCFENSIDGPIVVPGVGALPNTAVRSTAALDSLMFGATVKFGCPRH
ncbi:MAG: OmpP1/FadL family transporter [Planctomycetaceae bacterium]